MHRKNHYVMYDQASGLAGGINTRRATRRIQRLRMLTQITVFGLAILSYLVALYLTSMI